MRIELSPWQSTETTIRVAAYTGAAAHSSDPKNRRRKREKSPPPHPASNGAKVNGAKAADADADGHAEDVAVLLGDTVATSFVHLTSKGSVRRARHKKQSHVAAGSNSMKNAYSPEDLTHPPCLVITSENCITVVGRHERDFSLQESTCRKYNCRPGTRFLPSSSSVMNGHSSSTSNGNKMNPSGSSSLPPRLIAAVLDEKHERLYAFQRENQRLISWSTLDDPTKDDLILKHSFDEPATSLDLVELATTATSATTASPVSKEGPTRVFCYGSLQDSKRLFVGTTSTTANATTGKEEQTLEVQAFDIPSSVAAHDDLRIVETVAQPLSLSNQQTAVATSTAGSKRKSTVMTSSSSSGGSTDSSCYFYQVLMARDRIVLVRHAITAATSALASTSASKSSSSRSSSKSNGSTTAIHAMQRGHVQAATIMLPPSMQQQHVMVETAQFVGLVPSDTGGGTAILTFQTSPAQQQQQQHQQQAEQSHPVYMVSISLRTGEIVAGPFAISCSSSITLGSSRRNEACLFMSGASGDASRQSIIIAVPSPLDDEIFLYDAIRGALIQRIEIQGNDGMHGQNKANRWSLAVDSKRSVLAILNEKNGKLCLSMKSLMATSRGPKVLSLADGLAASASSMTPSLTSLPTTSALAVGDLTTALGGGEHADDGSGKRKKLKLIATPGQRVLIVQSLLILRKAHDEIRDACSETTASVAATKTKAIPILKAGSLHDAFEAAVELAATADGDSTSSINNNESFHNEQENDDIIVVSANPQDDRSPLYDSASPKLKPSHLINGLISHAEKAVNGNRTPTLVPAHEQPAPPAATTTTTTSANATSESERRNSRKTLNSLPTGFVNGAVALIVQILMLPPGDHSMDRKAIHDEARLILGRLLKTKKASARALFQACSHADDSKKSLQKFLRSLENGHGERHGLYTTMDFALDLLQCCVDVSERHMMLLVEYMLTASRPEDIATCFLRNKTRSDIVKNASYISFIAMSDRFIKLQENLRNKNKDASSSVGDNDTQDEKNDCHAEEAKEMDTLSCKLVLAGTYTLLDTVLSYSDCNETLIRGSLTEFIPRSGRLVLAKMLWENRSQPRNMTPVGGSSHVAKANRLVKLLSALCDTLQDGQACSESELAFFKSMQAELDREVHGADAILHLQQTMNEAEMRIQQATSAGADASGPTKQQLHPYQLERLVF